MVGLLLVVYMQFLSLVLGFICVCLGFCLLVCWAIGVSFVDGLLCVVYCGCLC